MKPSIDEWLEDIKKSSNNENLGMILIHNGIVRGSSKKGSKKVKGIRLSYNKELLEKTIEELSSKDGIEKIKVWINEGELKVGDDIMLVLVAGRYRTDVLPVFKELIEKIKNEVVKEEEIF